MEHLVLIGCECSGTIRNAFRNIGVEAYSCDLKKSEDNSPYHIVGDVFDVVRIINPNLFIVHPPCTFLSAQGAVWLDDYRFPTRRADMQKAGEFAYNLFNLPIPHICLENPVGMINQFIGAPTQIIHPYMFGDNYMKKTCLWLKNLPMLVDGKHVDRGEMITYRAKDGKVKQRSKWFSDAKSNDLEMTRTIRSRTFPGIANAMATQWTNYLNNINPFLISN